MAKRSTIIVHLEKKPRTYSINLSHEHVFVPIRGGRDRSSSQLSLFPEGIPSGNFNIAIENGHL